MQRLVDRAGIVTSEAVVEEFKRIHGEHGVSLVFMGLGRIKYLFEQDTQLEDRWSEERRLEPFRCFYQAESNGSRFIERDEPQWAEWRGVLYALQQVTGLQSAEPLSDEDMARRLYFATGGVMRRLKILLKQAIRGMGAECDKRVGLPHLHQAYERQGRHAHNPFSLIFPAEMSLPQIEDDYQLRASPEKRRAQKRAASPSGRSLGARVADALRARR
jgi:hypothetical protein